MAIRNGFFARLVALKVVAVASSALAADQHKIPPVTTVEGSESRIMMPVAYFAYPVDENALLAATQTCGFVKFSLGEYVDSRRLFVEPEDWTDQKTACLKGWASSQKNLRVEWFK
jgi:hypothetical protein